jgi:polyisoprenyl-phosphate glycosyltransferase
LENFKLSVIIPVYNEEKNIPALLTRLKKITYELNCEYEFIFSMDPCKDQTEKVILDFRNEDNNIKLIKMSRRFGQPACTQAGIYYCNGDICVVIDADLQDPPELIIEMVEKWKEGYHVVYAQRINRKGETLIKKIVSFFGYWMINRISEVKIPRNTGDFRLMSREVIEQLKNMKEHDGFLRGLVAYIGFNQIGIKYNREARFAGKGKYNRLLGSLRIGLNGVLGFSKYPLHLISIMGFLISMFSFILGLAYLILKIINYDIKWGNPTLVILISFFSGVQLLSLGVIGEYFARIYDEIKHRPIFIVQDAHGFERKINEKQ